MDLKIHMHVAILLERQPQKKETKEENSTVTDSGCTGNFMAVSSNLKNVQLKTRVIN